MRKQFLAAAPAALMAIGAVVGCASHPPAPVADLTRAHTLVAQAQAGDAPRYDSLDLTAAQDKLQQADSSAQSQPIMAGQLAQEASANAELALARTRAREAQESLGQVNDSLAALRAQTSHVDSGDGASPDEAPQELPAPLPPASQGGQ